jgi:hypothetical protein
MRFERLISEHVLRGQGQELFMAIAFIFMALWFVLKLATDRLRNQPPPAQRLPRPPLRAEGRPAPGPVRDPREEVAEFLRRAQMRRGGEAPPQPAKPKRPSSAERRKQGREAQRREPPPLRSTKQSAQQVPIPAVVLHAKADAESTRRPLGGLGSEITQRHFESNIGDPYAQSTGTLSELGSTEPIRPEGRGDSRGVPTSAVDIAAILSDGGKLRDAIILNEILQPPRDRW